MIDKSIIIAGTVSNSGACIRPVYKNIKKISNWFTRTRCIFIESDSIDNTIEILRQEKQASNIETEVYSFGHLRHTISHRTGRIAAARNLYLDIVEEQYSDYDYLLVLDFNESNIDEIDEESIISNFRYEEWDMMCANQEKFYYDLWALRHPTWMPFDCWNRYDQPEGFTREELTLYFIKSRFRHIPKDSKLLEVQSAFGGAAFINIKSIKGARHESIDDRGNEACEWISFCNKLNNGKSNIYINPKFINQKQLSRHIAL